MSRRPCPPGGEPPWKSADWGRHEWKRHGSWDYRPGAKAWHGFGRMLIFGFVVIMVVIPLLIGTTFWLIGRMFASWAGAAIIGPLLVVLLIMLVARSGARTWRPVSGIIEAAGDLADGDYSVRVTPSGNAATRRVVRSFNDMAERLETADEQRRQLLADLGHELRTPLTVVRGEIEAMVDGVHEPDPQHLEQLLEEVAVMERLLEDLRTLSMAEAGALALHAEPSDLSALVADAVESHRRSADAQGVAMTVTEEGELGEILIDPVRIREVVANLVVNSLRAMPEGGALAVKVGRQDGHAVIRVRDTGSGIAEDELEHVFERFEKGSTSAGSGLGLTISRDLVEAHGGSIAIDSRVGVGTVAEVRLPIRRA